MGQRDPRVDAYIKNAAPFAQPILGELREIVHDACPDVEEDIKWRFPHFLYKGMLCSMASFTRHAAFGFWKGALVTGGPRSADAMGHFGRLTKVSDLPSRKVLAGLIAKAARLNEQGIKVARVKKAGPAKPVTLPAELAAALKKTAKRLGGLKKKAGGGAGLPRAQPEPQARIHRVDHRGQNGRHAGAPCGAGDRM